MSEPRDMNWSEANRGELVSELARIKQRFGAQQIEVAACTPEAPSTPTAIDRLTHLFGLSRFERDVLLLCAGVEMDAQLAALCAHAQGLTRSAVTFALALSILDEAHWSALAPLGPLRRWRLVEIDDSTGIAHGKLRIDERILHYLAGVNHLDMRLRPILQQRRPGGAMAPSHRDICDSVLARIAETQSGASVVMLAGDDRSGQIDVAAQIAADLGMHLHVLKSERLPTSAAEVDAFATLWTRESLLLGSALLIECADRDAPASLTSFVERAGGLVFVVGAQAQRTHPLIEAIVDKPEAIDQRTLWEQALGPAVSRINGALSGIAAQFRLSAATIDATGSAVREAIMKSASPDALLWRVCREAGGSSLDELAQGIRARATWDALVLPDAQKATLHLIVAHVRHRLAVYEDWGFAASSTRGLGITALFAGESGTGKTMAAEVLANELDLDLYRIDLSTVVSKYIGDTEKNLRRVFDAAEESGAILLFDEADALFGKRSEVKDSHDRYANIEVSYLLQRMEAYRGLAILTTNMKGALDSAFKRRLRFIVQFPFPDVAQREAIWRSIFPAATPTEGLDCEKLARLNVSGGNIRNIALNAAFLAAAAREPVRMAHVLEAAHSEGVKRDRPLSDAETRGWV